MKIIICLLVLLAVGNASGQSLSDKLSSAVEAAESSKELRHAIVALYVADAATGKVVYAHNAQAGLAPASTQKLFTSIAALETLGSSFRYETVFGIEGNQLVIEASGDPSLGSDRYAGTKAVNLLNSLKSALQQRNATIEGIEIRNPKNISDNAIPGGWIWEDIGNYYGAPSRSFNWQENQFDILLQSGQVVGEPVTITGFEPMEAAIPLRNKVRSAAPGTGDNTIVYLPLGADSSLIDGTIPVNEKKFVVSAAVSHPARVFFKQLLPGRSQINIRYVQGTGATATDGYQLLYRHFSPDLDSLTYCFLRKSINLYGEALLQRLAAEKTGTGNTGSGTAWLKKFWSARDIDSSALHVYDGSGLSPQNRVTADALVTALLYAKSRPWFKAFYNALPEYNGMKMKSGSINGARAFAGFHTSAHGREYVFAIIINNYDGAALAATRKIYALLDLLK